MHEHLRLSLQEAVPKKISTLLALSYCKQPALVALYLPSGAHLQTELR